MIRQLHSPEAARCLARTLAEAPLTARERRVILMYLRYALDGPITRTDAIISPLSEHVCKRPAVAPVSHLQLAEGAAV